MNYRIRSVVGIFLCILLLGQSIRAQPLPPAPPDPAGINQGRFIGVVIGTAAFYGLTLFVLHKQWYKKRVPFHSFNDNAEWLQMDKIGHATTAYCMSRGGYELMRWSGVNEHDPQAHHRYN